MGGLDALLPLTRCHLFALLTAWIGRQKVSLLQRNKRAKLKRAKLKQAKLKRAETQAGETQAGETRGRNSSGRNSSRRNGSLAIADTALKRKDYRLLRADLSKKL